MSEPRAFSKKFKKPSLTKQSFREECDINHMIKTFQSSGTMPAINGRLPGYGDFSQIGDFHSALNQVHEANTAFAAFPSEIRKRFGNKAQNMLNFLSDSENDEEARELGLIAPLPESEQKTVVTPHDAPSNTKPEAPAPPETGGGATA